EHHRNILPSVFESAFGFCTVSTKPYLAAKIGFGLLVKLIILRFAVHQDRLVVRPKSPLIARANLVSPDNLIDEVTSHLHHRKERREVAGYGHQIKGSIISQGRETRIDPSLAPLVII